MRKILLVSVLAMFVFSLVALAAPDPWRIRITDLNPNGSVPGIGTGNTKRVWSPVPLEDWTADGGTIWFYYRDFNLGQNMMRVEATYDASSGALSFGTVTQASVEGLGRKDVGPIMRVGSIYKSWAGFWTVTYTGMDICYSTSTDGLSWAVPTLCTVYGSTVQSTGSYFPTAVYLSTGGVYLKVHSNSYSVASGGNGKGMATSGVGETVWYDIDTGDPDLIAVGDPIAEPHTLGSPLYGLENHSRLPMTCTGNLMATMSPFDQAQAEAGRGTGIMVGTAGDLAGGDHYVWISDPDNSHTSSTVSKSILSAIGLPGLSGDSLRTWGGQVRDRGWHAYPVALDSAQTNPATSFVLFYNAWWDTDSSPGSGLRNTSDEWGLGRAKLWLTRNKADSNFDGTVDFLDVAPVSSGYGSASGDAGYKEKGDLNQDGFIDESDVAILSNRYGSDCSYGTGS